MFAGLPPKRGLKYYAALQYRVLKYYGPSRKSRRLSCIEFDVILFFVFRVSTYLVFAKMRRYAKLL